VRFVVDELRSMLEACRHSKTRDDHPAFGTRVKRPHMRVTTTQSNTLPSIAEMARGSCYGGTRRGASGEAVLRECVGRPVSISVSQFAHNALVGNPNQFVLPIRLVSPGFGSPSPCRSGHTMNTGWTQASCLVWQNHWPLALPQF
jgi:hypothetical protein